MDQERGRRVNPAWTVRASLAPDGTAKISTRAHGWTLGQPLDFGAPSTGASALESLLAALGGDVLLRYAELCDRRRLILDQVEVRVSGRLGNALVALGVVGESGDPGLAEASLTLSVVSPAAEADLHCVWQDVLARSPLVATLRKAATLDLQLQIL